MENVCFEFSTFEKRGEKWKSLLVSSAELMTRRGIKSAEIQRNYMFVRHKWNYGCGDGKWKIVGVKISFGREKQMKTEARG
jgi:hypothetical protein